MNVENVVTGAERKYLCNIRNSNITNIKFCDV